MSDTILSRARAIEHVGIVTDITRFATHDGPGIRTTVFLKGCPLRCEWCSNPETQSPFPEVFYREKLCQRYGECSKVCSAGAIDLESATRIDRGRCTLCMECVSSCPQNVYRQVGVSYTAADIVKEIEKDVAFYGNDGGLTLSGGEPLSQGEFAIEVLRRCKDKGIATVLDTSGYAAGEVIEEAGKYSDLVLYDVKHMDPRVHAQGVGVSNELILSNAVRLASMTNMRISFPLVPSFNDSAENIQATATFAKGVGVEWVDINPMHRLGTAKYAYLGLPSPYTRYRKLTRDDVLRAQAMFVRSGLQTTVGRMM